MEMFSERKVGLPRGQVGICASGPTFGVRSRKFTNAATEVLMRKLFGDAPHSSAINNLLGEVAIGTGTQPINYTTTGLTTEVGRADIDEPAVAGTAEIGGITYNTLTVTATFAPGVLVGELSEVGLVSADGLLAGTLVKDETDAPAPITVAADDQIVVTYTLAFDLNGYPAEISTGTINVNGVDHDYVAEHIEIFEVSGNVIYAKNPSRDLSSNSDKTIFLNGAISTSSNSTVTRSQVYDAVERSTEWVYEATIFATFDNGDISTLGLLPVGKGSFTSSPTEGVRLTFTPAIARPADNKIVIRYRFKIYW